MINEVISTNLKVSQGNLFVLTFIFWLEIIFLLVIYDLVIFNLYSVIRYYLRELGEWAVRTKKVSCALYIIRLNYYFLRLSRLLRLGWVTYDSDEKSLVWIGISKLTVTKLIFNIFKIIISIPMLLAFLSACFSLRILRVDITHYLSKFQEILISILQIKVNISDVFLRLPAIVALVTILPTVFFFYFYSQKREVRKVIDKENGQYFEEVILLFEKLLIWVNHHIYQISENFDYVINCQDLIIEVFLEKEIPNYVSLTEKKYYRTEGIEEFNFLEISDLSELREIVTRLMSDRLIKFTRIFSINRFDIWQFYLRDFDSLSEEEEIEKLFYTQKGMASKLAKRYTYSYDVTKDKLEQERKKEQSCLSWSIYNNLESLYRLMRMRNSLRSYLYSSRMERLILKVLNKDR
ncbi:hypothetical protein QM857_06475 [Streptococcus infantis]|uniref:hypothetical protein n=1 Tax=Streptococcus infantis TaxID=68892 RepID=UPI0039C1D01C